MTGLLSKAFLSKSRAIPATDETGGNKFLSKFMIELSRTIFFSRSDTRPYISRPRETFFYFPPFSLFLPPRAPVRNRAD